MVNKTIIQQNLKRIDKLYNKHIGGIEADYYSKLALLEVCGWIEETMDDIVRSCARKHLKKQNSFDSIEKVIENTHSFKYQSNFQNMLRQLVGLINLEKLENNYNSIKFQLLASSLGTLKQYRDEHAHTYIKGQTNTFYAPSFTISHFYKVYDGLKDIERCIRKCIIK